MLSLVWFDSFKCAQLGHKRRVFFLFFLSRLQKEFLHQDFKEHLILTIIDLFLKVYSRHLCIPFLTFRGSVVSKTVFFFFKFIVVDSVVCMHLLPLLPAVLPKGVPEKDKTS